MYCIYNENTQTHKKQHFSYLEKTIFFILWRQLVDDLQVDKNQSLKNSFLLPKKENDISLVLTMVYSWMAPLILSIITKKPKWLYNECPKNVNMTKNVQCHQKFSRADFQLDILDPRILHVTHICSHW